MDESTREQISRALMRRRLSHQSVDALVIASAFIKHPDKKVLVVDNHCIRTFEDMDVRRRERGLHDDLILHRYTKTRGVDLTLHKGEYYAEWRKKPGVYGIDANPFIALCMLYQELLEEFGHNVTFTKIYSN